MKKDITSGFVWAGLLLGVAVAATAGRRFGLIDQDMVGRIVLGLTGLMLAWYGNRMPKVVSSSSGAAKVARVGGWSTALSGLVYAGLWAFAPKPIALVVGSAAIVAGVIITVFYCRSLRRRALTA